MSPPCNGWHFLNRLSDLAKDGAEFEGFRDSTPPPGPVECAERLKSARPLLAGEPGRAGSRAQFLLVPDPLK